MSNKISDEELSKTWEEKIFNEHLGEIVLKTHWTKNSYGWNTQMYIIQCPDCSEKRNVSKHYAKRAKTLYCWKCFNKRKHEHYINTREDLEGKEFVEDIETKHLGKLRLKLLYKKTSEDYFRKFYLIKCPICGKTKMPVKERVIELTTFNCYQCERTHNPKLDKSINGYGRLSRGYIVCPIYPNDPYYCMGRIYKRNKRKYNSAEIFAHRLIMARHLKRPLKKCEHVHHINGVKTDNRPENLQIVSASEHSKITATHYKNLSAKLKEENKMLTDRVQQLERELEIKTNL